MKIETVNINELISPEWNPRHITPEAMESLKKSINEFGYVAPIIVNKYNNHILAGNQRIEALKQLGHETVEVVYTNVEDLDKEKALNIRLNNLSGDWDIGKLDNIFQDLEVKGFDLTLTGFQTENLQPFETSSDTGIPTSETITTDLTTGLKPIPGQPETTNEYTEPEHEIKEDNYQQSDVKVHVAKGDLFKLGNHYLFCGDATSKDDVEILLNAERERALIDLVFTDPPYGMKKEKDGVMNDNLNYADLLEFNKQWIPLTFKALKSNGSWYCWGIDQPLMDIYSNILKPMIKNNEITFRNYITWAKHMAYGINAEPMRQYPTETEKCLFVMKGVQGFNTNADNYWEEWEPIRKYLEDSRNIMGWTDEEINKITGVTTCARHYFNKSQWTFPTREHYLSLQKEAEKQLKERGKKDYDAFKKDYDALKKEWYSTRAYFNNTHNDPTQDEIMTDVWRFSTTSITERETCGDHATPKPLRLCARAILSSSRENENVLDVFGGSGSTLIACEETNRNRYMMELDPYYCQVIINRWEQYTGKTAVKIN